MANETSKTLYLFVDESGNFDFSSRGTKYFVLSCLSTFYPTAERDNLIKLRYKLLEEGLDQEFFHATEDRQVVRDRVFSIINNLTDDIEVHAIVAQKNKVNPSLYREVYFKKDRRIERVVGADFYQRMSRTLLQYVFHRSDFKKADKIVVVLGAIFTKSKQSYILQTLKKYLKERFAKPFEVYFHQSRSDLNCQLADYFGWAIAIKWERGEQRSYILVADKIKSEFDIFKTGETSYYDYQ